MGGTIVWFRLDLRTADHPPLAEAIRSGGPVYPVFIYSPDEDSPWQPGGATKWWLHQSLSRLAADLESRGSRLILRHGAAGPAIAHLVRETGATAVHYSRRQEPALREQERDVARNCEALGAAPLAFNSSLLDEPNDIRTGEGNPYKVFTPYWRACTSKGRPAAPLPAPARIPAPAHFPESMPLESLQLEPRLNWPDGMRAHWQPGEQGAQTRLRRFLNEAALQYETGRDLPADEGVSRLSPHLHFGEISPRQIWHAVDEWRETCAKPGADRAAQAWIRQLYWREFAHHLLFHYPQTTFDPLRREFRDFPWRQGASAHLKAWQKGLTGYPIVDAGMRELWTTGWMHNRVRMIVASFLVKDLLIAWQEGAAWFWDTLVDADLANNTLGWQWVAGCGADAAPYFRVFNPMSQGEKFDPKGEYVRRWIPELARLPNKIIHRPWEAAPFELLEAGVHLGGNYPAPIVDHARAREKALMAYEHVKDAGRKAKIAPASAV